jgi:flagellar protein FliL
VAAKQNAPTKKGGSSLVLVAVAAVAIGGGGAGTYFMMHRPAGAPAATKPTERGLLTLEPFVVNLADAGGSRFLRVSIRLVVGSPEQAEHIQKGSVALVRVRSAILELLTQQTADHLVTAQGKEELKKAIAERADTVLEETKVTDVLFSDFVVQF